MSDQLDNLLAPLCRLLVVQGVAFADWAERTKGHYVQEAMKIAASDGKVTDSRLSVLTGLQRRDVARLKEFEVKAQRPNHLSRLVATWQTSSSYSKSSKPLPLPRNGPSPSFESLAFEIRKDVHPRTMLDALLAAGTVSLSEDDQIVRLIETAYIPLSGSAEQIGYLSSNVGDHLAAAVDNVLGHAPKHFERAVHYDGLTKSQVAELAHKFHDGQMTLLEALSKEAAEMKRKNEPEANARFRAGGYSYSSAKDTK